jgi:5-formyltetrahydrofolate cyclo-ligase
VARLPGAPDAIPTKGELRHRVLARRDALEPAERARLSAAIVARLSALDAVRRARTVLAYAPFGSEPDTWPLLRAVLAEGRALLLPRVDRAARRLVLHRVTDLEADLAPGTWGILEPIPARCPVVLPPAADVVLVPGVAFDRSGGRLGYGGGYYDRLLAAWPPPRPPLVAPAFELQVVAQVPLLPGDHRVDRVVTESYVYPAPPTEGS